MLPTSAPAVREVEREDRSGGSVITCSLFSVGARRRRPAPERAARRSAASGETGVPALPCRPGSDDGEHLHRVLVLFFPRVAEPERRRRHMLEDTAHRNTALLQRSAAEQGQRRCWRAPPVPGPRPENAPFAHDHTRVPKTREGSCQSGRGRTSRLADRQRRSRYRRTGVELYVVSSVSSVLGRVTA